MPFCFGVSRQDWGLFVEQTDSLQTYICHTLFELIDQVKLSGSLICFEKPALHGELKIKIGTADQVVGGMRPKHISIPD